MPLVEQVRAIDRAWGSFHHWWTGDRHGDTLVLFVVLQAHPTGFALLLDLRPELSTPAGAER
jgi:hypothetical protein